MDLGLNEIQQMLKTSAQDFLARECPLTLVREMEEDSKGYTDNLWRQMISLGWTGVAFPEQYGGTGGTFADLGVLLEEIGRSLAPSPFFSTVVLGGMTVEDGGNDAQKDEILSRICAGTIIMTMGVTEASVSTEAWGVEATATQQGSNYQITGTKLFVPDAETADTILVAARTSSDSDPAKGISLFLVPLQCQWIDHHPHEFRRQRTGLRSFLGKCNRACRRHGRSGRRGLANNRTSYHASHCRPVYRDAGRRSGGFGNDRRICQGPHPVWPTHRQLPGRATPLRTDGHRR